MYWMYKFRNVTSGSDPLSRTSLQTHFFGAFAVSSTVPSLLAVLLATLVNDRIRQEVRNVLSLCLCLVLMAAVMAFVQVDTDSYGRETKGGHTGSRRAQAVAGVFASGLQVVTLLGHTDPCVAALAYFGCALVVLLVSLLCFMAMQSSMWMQGTSSALVFGVSMMVFPAVTVLVVSQNVLSGSAWTGSMQAMISYEDLEISVSPLVVFRKVGRFFIPVCNYLLFNLGDLSGRVACAWLPLEKAGFLMTLCTMVGLCVGSFFSVILVKLL
ncbi:equilibrative nucleoside transporter, putative [Ixodes scapularis]|uniref:Equilibrative nucleoside transporter, putative n=1 Tax=Ixodes scapularis TaxID=6945 RepID=B7Q1C1_IXOSC|nr:equilibrative nucleoside transporter, putative [Ixodes scapularis]|eukprot:XP_002409298.1 equilibrative nucleoside transporter, putative [Ixodes scapularis]